MVSPLRKVNFEVEYRKGAEMVSADAPSRSLLATINYSEEPELQGDKKRTLDIHNRLSHRKKIKKHLNE